MCACPGAGKARSAAAEPAARQHRRHLSPVRWPGSYSLPVSHAQEEEGLVLSGIAYLVDICQTLLTILPVAVLHKPRLDKLRTGAVCGKVCLWHAGGHMPAD